MQNLKDPNLLKDCSYINGQWLTADKQFEVVNPADQSIIAKVSEVTDEQLELAVKSSQAAQKSWAQVPAKKRAKILQSWFKLILEHKQDLALIMTHEQGKSLTEATGEIIYGANYIEWFAEEAKRIYGEITPAAQNDRKLLTISQPVGVVSAITPWNFPSAMITRKAAPAFASGCSMIVKPSELTPLSALAIAELADRCDFPKGLFNVVVGAEAQRIGEVLTTHPTIRKFSFTGSTQVGKKLLAQCADTVKRTSLELGGNAPMIVFADADLDLAVQGTLNSKFRNAGQTCVCTNRIFVEQSIQDEFINKLETAVKALKTGPSLEGDFDFGPLINKQAIEKITDLIESSCALGAKVKFGGKISPQGAQFFEPTLIDNVSVAMPIAKQEIFGPVASVISFEDEQQVIEWANDTRYGLAAYCYTADMARSFRMAEQLEFGMVGINEALLSAIEAPFGGIKESGMGREGSRHGMDDYLEKKYICLGNL
jgi:succinate-semialdehyde dehydrogenase / glutarate-semialdehyde dehydrogenase